MTDVLELAAFTAARDGGPEVRSRLADVLWFLTKRRVISARRHRELARILFPGRRA